MHIMYAYLNNLTVTQEIDPTVEAGNRSMWSSDQVLCHLWEKNKKEKCSWILTS